MDLILSPAALADLEEIQQFIAQGSPRAAAAEMARLDRAIQRLLAGKLQGPEVRFLSDRRAQRWTLPPYRIYYRRTARRTTILRVSHQARRPIER